MIHLIVDEGDIRQSHRETLRRSTQVGAFVPPRLLVDDASPAEQIPNPVAGDEVNHRGTVLCGRDHELRRIRAPPQHVDQCPVGTHELAPPLGFGTAEDLALAIEVAVEILHENRIEGLEVVVVLRLVLEFHAGFEGQQRDAEVFGPIAQRHQCEKALIQRIAGHGRTRLGTLEPIPAGEQASTTGTGANASQRAQCNPEALRSAVRDDAVEIESQNLHRVAPACRRSGGHEAESAAMLCGHFELRVSAWHPIAQPALCCPAVKFVFNSVARQLLPWSISIGALVYVFGYKIDWQSIPEATANANFPLFVAITVFDKLSFFVVWGLFQAAAIRQFVERVPIRKIMAVKGASELLRTVNNSLADATFLIGVSQLVRTAGVTRVVAIASIPFVAHFAVLLLQATLALGLLEGGIGANRDVVILVAVSWGVVVGVSVAVHRGYLRAALERMGIGGWIDSVKPRQLIPYVGWFGLFGVYDVAIQGLAARSFGIDIDWIALVARIPVMYLALLIPSLGNFGTREIAFASLFDEYGSREALYAFALWTNAIFLAMHVIIGALFLNRAFALVREVRTARELGHPVPRPILRDAIDP